MWFLWWRLPKLPYPNYLRVREWFYSLPPRAILRWLLSCKGKTKRTRTVLSKCTLLAASLSTLSTKVSTKVIQYHSDTQLPVYLSTPSLTMRLGDWNFHLASVPSLSYIQRLLSLFCFDHPLHCTLEFSSPWDSWLTQPTFWAWPPIFLVTLPDNLHSLFPFNSPWNFQLFLHLPPVLASIQNSFGFHKPSVKGFLLFIFYLPLFLCSLEAQFSPISLLFPLPERCPAWPRSLSGTFLGREHALHLQSMA